MVHEEPAPKDDVPLPRSENLLPEVITVILESKQKVAMNVAAELCIPDDPDGMWDAALHAHERYAFWSYQTERAKAKADAAELVYKRTWAEYHLGYRSKLRDDSDFMPTEAEYKAHTEIDKNVQNALAKWNAAKKTHGVLRTMKEAMYHRCFIATRLVDRFVKMKEG
jgi:hypothetical protein